MSKRKLEEVDKARHALEQSDSILNTDVLKSVTRFCQAGGTPPEVVELLSDNFRGFVQMTNLLTDWMPLIGYSEPATQKLITDNLTDSINTKFNPQRADAVFSSASSAPKWLEQMIDNSDWRALLYSLSGAHKNCLLLNFAIQSISDAGHQHEIASSRAGSSDLAVYTGVLQTELIRLQSVPLDTLTTELETFVGMASESHAGYLLAQIIILRTQQILPRENQLLSLLSQELEEHAVKHCSGSARNTSWQLAGVQEYPVLFTTLNFLVRNGQKVSMTDIIKLERLYSSATPPPVRFLQRKDVLLLLLSQLFDAEKQQPAANRAKLQFLISYAACASAGTAARPTEAIESTVDALEKAKSACLMNPHAIEELKQLVHSLRPLVIDKPVVALGVLEWIRIQILKQGSARESCTTAYLSLMATMMQEHPLLWPMLLSVLTQCLYLQLACKGGAAKDQRIELAAAERWKRQILDATVQLLRHGCVLPVLTALTQWAQQGADAALHRHAVSKVFETAEPPYSAQFAGALVQLVCVKAQGVGEALKASINELLEECDRLKPQLSKAVLSSVAELSAACAEKAKEKPDNT